ncbi:MAG: ParB/Srx family N-terminal domain-containing protein, partial [Proteobacteria bacterium]|nr:ParB/Srx family N-terminal domain-containing protein [Pseudomonadota bacterium]
MSELVSIASLVFDPANARKHDKKNLDAIKGSLARFGQQKPIVVSKDNVVIAGNGTLAAARELGWSEIEVKRSKLTGVEAIAYALADNRSAELAAWDDEILGKTLHALQEDGFPIADIGFDPGDFWDE